MTAPFRKRRIEPLLQSAYAECGLVCIAMMLRYFGKAVTLTEIRERWQCSPRALRLGSLIDILDSYGVVGRPLRAELADLRAVRGPSIIHWDFNHYVILERIDAKSIHIVDPAVGRRRIPLSEANLHFTGVVLEIEPADFSAECQAAEKPIGLSDLLPRKAELLKLAAPVILFSILLNTIMLSFPLFVKFCYEKIIPTHSQDVLNKSLLIFLSIPAFYFFIQNLRINYLAALREKLAESMCEFLFKNLVLTKYSFFEARSSGRIVNQYNSVQAITATLAEQITSGGVDCLFVAVGLLLLALISMPVFLVAFVSVAFYLAIQGAAMREICSRLTGSIQSELIEHGFLTETVESMSAIRIYGAEMSRLSMWRTVHADVRRTQRLYWRYRHLVAAVQEVVLNGGWLAAIYFAVASNLSEGLSLGMVAAAISWSNVVLTRCRDVSQSFLAVFLLKTHLARVDDLVRSPKISLEDRSDRKKSGREEVAEIGMRDVWYRYDEFSPWILKACSFQVAKGSFTGIVGVSGVGKTTLLKLLAGLLEPSRGQVLVNGAFPGNEQASGIICANAGVVMQNDVLMQGSILENVSFFEVDPDVERVKHCIRLSCMGDYVEGLPLQYDTLLGPRGQGFSSGQIQRLVLARALYRDPRILLLDEFSSNIDEETERTILKNIRNSGITVISVAHRRQVIEACTQIVNIQDGSASFMTNMLSDDYLKDVAV